MDSEHCATCRSALPVIVLSCICSGEMRFFCNYKCHPKHDGDVGINLIDPERV